MAGSLEEIIRSSSLDPDLALEQQHLTRDPTIERNTYDRERPTEAQRMLSEVEPRESIELSKAAQEIYADMRAKEALEKKLEPKGLDRLYQDFGARNGYSREYVRDNYKEVENERYEKEIAPIIKKMHEADPESEEAFLASLDADATPQDLASRGFVSLALKSLKAGYTSVQKSEILDDMEELFRENGTDTSMWDEDTWEGLRTLSQKHWDYNRELGPLQKEIERRYAEGISEGKALSEIWGENRFSPSAFLKLIGHKMTSPNTYLNVAQAGYSVALPMAYTVGGAALAPFTGGASLLAGIGGAGLSGYAIAQESKLAELISEEVDPEDPEALVKFFSDREKVDKMVKKSRIYGGVIGGTEALAGWGLTKLLGPSAGKAMGALNRVKNAKVRAAAASLGKISAGGGLEGTQESVGELVATRTIGEKMTAEEFVDNFIAGALLGAGVTGAGLSANYAKDYASEYVDRVKKEAAPKTGTATPETDEGVIAPLSEGEKTPIKPVVDPEAKPEGELKGDVEVKIPDGGPVEEGQPLGEMEPLPDIQVEPEAEPVTEPVEPVTEPEAEPVTEPEADKGIYPEFDPKRLLDDDYKDLSVQEAQARVEEEAHVARTATNAIMNTVAMMIRLNRTHGMFAGENYSHEAATLALNSITEDLPLTDVSKAFIREMLSSGKNISKDELLELEATVETSQGSVDVKLKHSLDALLKFEERMGEVLKRSDEETRRIAVLRQQEISERAKEVGVSDEHLDFINNVVGDFYRKMESITGVPWVGVSPMLALNIKSEPTSSALGQYFFPVGEIRQREEIGGTGLEAPTLMHEYTHMMTYSIITAYTYLSSLKSSLKGTDQKLSKEQLKFMKMAERIFKLINLPKKAFAEYAGIQDMYDTGSFRVDKDIVPGGRKQSIGGRVSKWLHDPHEILTRMSEYIFDSHFRLKERPYSLFEFFEHELVKKGDPNWISIKIGDSNADWKDLNFDEAPYFYTSTPDKPLGEMRFDPNKRTPQGIEPTIYRVTGLKEDVSDLFKEAFGFGPLVKQAEDLVNNSIRPPAATKKGPTKTELFKEAIKLLLRKYANNSQVRETAEYKKFKSEAEDTAKQLIEERYPVLKFIRAFKGSYALDVGGSREYLKENKLGGIPRSVLAEFKDVKGDETISILDISNAAGFKTVKSFLNAAREAPVYDKEVERLSGELADAEFNLDGDSMRSYLVDFGDGITEEFIKAVGGELEALRAQFKAVYRKSLGDIAGYIVKSDEIKAVAAQRFTKLTLKEARPNNIYNIAKKHARDAASHLRRGDVDKAYLSKVEQAIALEMWRHSQKYRAFVDKHSRKFRKYAKYNVDSETRDVNAVSAIKGALSMLGIIESPDHKIMAHLKGLKKYNPEGYREFEEKVKGILLSADEAGGSLETVDGFYKVATMLEQMWDFAAITQEGRDQKSEQEILATLEPAKEALSEVDAKKRGTVMKLLMSYDAQVTVAVSWLRRLDTKLGITTFTKKIVDPVRRAEREYEKNAEENDKKLSELFKKYIKPQGKRAMKQEIRFEVGGTVFEFANKKELLAALLNTGNMGNFANLLIGKGWGKKIKGDQLDTANWDAFVKWAETEGVITKADYDYVQGIWDIFAEKLPDAQRVFNELTGGYTGEVEAIKIKTKWGDYKGGYYPMVISEEARVERNIESDELDILKRTTEAYSLFAKTDDSFMINRVPDEGKDLSLDLHRAGALIQRVQRFIDFQVTIHNSARLLMSKGVRKEIERVSPGAWKNILQPWLVDTANQQRIKRMESKEWEKVATTMRSLMSFKTMFGNLANSALQFTGFFLAVPKVGVKRVALGILQGNTARIKTIYEKSEVMKRRAHTHINVYQDQLDSIVGDKSKSQMVFEYTYLLQAFTQGIVDRGVWAGAYDKAISRGDSEQAAIKFADDVVEDTQGSASVSQLANIEKTNAFAKLLTMFQRFAIMRYNLIKEGVTESIGPEEFKLVKHGPAVFSHLLFVAVLPELLAAILYGAVYGGDDEDDWGPDLTIDFLIGSTVALLPIAGNLLRVAAESVVKDKPARIELSPATRLGKDVVETIREFGSFLKGEEGTEFTEKALNTIMPAEYRRTMQRLKEE